MAGIILSTFADINSFNAPNFYGIVIVKIPVFTDELPEVRKDRILAQGCTSNKVVELHFKVRPCSQKIRALSHDTLFEM